MSDTLAGARIGLVTAMPATYNAAGFAALTFEYGICALKSVPKIDGKVFTSVEDKTVCNRGSKQKKGSYSRAPVTYNLNVEDDCPAQVIYQDLLESPDDTGSFCLELKTGKKIYFTAQVAKFSETEGGEGDTIDLHAVELWPQSDFVVVAAP